MEKDNNNIKVAERRDVDIEDVGPLAYALKNHIREYYGKQEATQQDDRQN